MENNNQQMIDTLKRTAEFLEARPALPKVNPWLSLSAHPKESLGAVKAILPDAQEKTTNGKPALAYHINTLAYITFYWENTEGMETIKLPDGRTAFVPTVPA